MFVNLAPYPEYGQNQTWEGLTPVHWKQGTMRAVAQERTVSGVPDEPLLSVSIKHGVTTQAALLSESSKRDGSNLDRSAYKLVEPGDIAYNKMRAWQGAAGISSSRGIVSPAYVVLRPNSTIAQPLYLHHLLRLSEYASEAARWSYGITSDQWSLRPEHFRRIPVSIPPLDEQEAIVTYLAHAHQRINQAIAIKRKLITLLEEERAVLARVAIGRGVNPHAGLVDLGAHLGPAPAHWLVTPIKRLALLKSGAGFPVTEQGRAGLEIPFFRVSDMTLPGNETRMAVSDSSVSREDATRLGAFVFPAGSIILPKVGGALLTNKRRVLSVPSCVDNNIMGVMFDERLIPRFRLDLLKQIDMSLVVNPGPVPAIGEASVGRILVAVPPVDEQARIVEHIARETAPMIQGIETTRGEVALLEEFRVRLTADVVTGQLDVRGVAAGLPKVHLEGALVMSSDGAGEDDEESFEDDEPGEA